MKSFTSILILTALSLAAVTKTNATIINVPAGQPNIQAGINAAINGDTVLVQPGTYYENINFNGKNITVASMFLMTKDTSYISQTIINGNQNGSVVTFNHNESKNALLFGFTVTNGLANIGGGVYCLNANPTFKYLKIVKNKGTSSGGGFIVSNSNSVFENVIFSENISDGYGSAGQGGISDKTITFINCIFKSHISNKKGGLFYTSCNTVFVNTTITANTANYEGIIYIREGHYLTIQNSIIYNNTPNLLKFLNGGTASVSHSDIQNGQGAFSGANLIWSDGNITDDPVFLDPSTNNFTLNPLSPCIDMGLNDPVLPEFDLNGNPRINFGYVDMGAYEFQQQTGQYLVLNYPNGNEIFEKNSSHFIIWDTNLEDVIIEFSSDGGTLWEVVVDSIFEENQFLWTVPNVMSENCKLKITSNSYPLLSDVSDEVFSIFSKVIENGATISGTWTLNESPIIVKGEAILLANTTLTIEPGVEVRMLTNKFATSGWLRIHGTLLAQGTVNDTIHFTRYGDEGNWKNILFYDSGSSSSCLSYCVIQFANESTYSNQTYDGAVSFRLSNALVSHSFLHDNASSAIYSRNYLSHPIISNCKINGGLEIHADGAFDVMENEILGYIILDESSTCNIIGNQITSAGAPNGYVIQGYYGSKANIDSNQITGSLYLSESTFNCYDNYISCGAWGIYLYDFSIAKFENTIIDGASNTGIQCIASDADVTNCLFVNNNVALNVDYVESDVIISNCIFYNNTISFKEDSYYLGLQNCLLEDTELPPFVSDLGGNILSSNPLFLNTGDHPYQLTTGSPAINAGYVNSSLVQETDLMGNPRVCNGRIDIGAYEMQESGDWLWLKSPIGNEYIEYGTNFPITWSCSDSLLSVSVEFFDGYNWSTLEDSVSNTLSNFSWLVPIMDSDECMIRVTDNSLGFIRTSEYPFHIKKKVIRHLEGVYGSWTIENSPYTVIGRAYIPLGKTLTIEPGVVVKFRTGKFLYLDYEFLDIGLIYAYGSTLIAQGTEANPITFTRDGDEGLWGVLYFQYNSSNILKHCNIEYSNAIFTHDLFYGGASFDGASAIVENCAFTNCFAGVVSAYSSSPTIKSSKFFFNFEGGTFCWKSSGTKIINNEFFGNIGYGIRCYQSSPAITNNTITFDGNRPKQILHNYNFIQQSEMLFKPENRNYLYGLYLESGSNPVIQNSIIYGNGVSGQGQNIYLSGSAPVISYSLLSDSIFPPGAVNGGNNIINQDPFFKVPERLDFSLQPGSPCINTANPVTTGLFLPELDLAGNPRIFDNERIDMGAYELQATVHKLELPKGWSGISSFIVPHETATESIFSPVENELVILQNFDGMYWPYAGVNTIPDWNDKGGYQIKMDSSQQLYFSGTRQDTLSLGLTIGWNYLPVLNSCINQSSELFAQISNKFTIVKEIAGGKVYWPQFNINSLAEIVPGKAYFILMENNAPLVFPVCIGLKNISKGTSDLNVILQKDLEKIIPWALPNPSPLSHIIAIPESVSSDMNDGNIIGAFDLSGHCYGFSVIDGVALSITVFSDDPYTIEKDGFTEGELIYFKLFDPQTKTESSLIAEYDPSLPDHAGTFKINGLSSLSSLKVGNVSIHENDYANVQIYPNPANERLNITLGNSASANIKLLNIQGQIMVSKHLDSSNSVLDISNLSNGMYLVEITIGETKLIRRLIKN